MTDLSTEIAQLPTVTSVAPSDWLVIQPGTGGTPLRKASAEQVMNGLIDAIGTGTIVADDVIITGGTATLDVGSITSLTAGTIDIKSGTGTLSTGSINTLTVSGTATVGLGAFTKLNAGTVDIDNGDALLQTATITSLNAGTIVGTTATLTSLNAGTVTITTGTGTLTALTVTGTLGAGTANLTTANIGHAAATSATVGTLVASAGTVTLASATVTDAVVSKGTIATLIANAGTVSLSKGTITDLASTTLAATGVATVGTLIANAGTVTLAKGTVTDLASTTLAASGTATVGHLAGTTGTITTGTIGTLTANAGTVTLGKATVTDAVVTTGTVGTLVSTVGTITAVNAGTIASSGAVTGASGTFTTGSIPTLTVSGTATVAALVGTTATLTEATIAGTDHQATSLTPGWSIQWQDGTGYTAAGITDDGTLKAARANIADATYVGPTLSPGWALQWGDGTGYIAGGITDSGELKFASADLAGLQYKSSSLNPGWARVWLDDSGYVAAGIKSDGEFAIGRSDTNNAVIGGDGTLTAVSSLVPDVVSSVTDTDGNIASALGATGRARFVPRTNVVARASRNIVRPTNLHSYTAPRTGTDSSVTTDSTIATLWTLDLDFDYIRVVLGQQSLNSMTAKVCIAATAGANDGVNPVDEVGDPGTWTDVTFNNAGSADFQPWNQNSGSTGTIVQNTSAESQVWGLTYSDWMQVSSLPRTDGSPYPLVMIRVHLTGTPAATDMSGSNLFGLTPTTSNFGRTWAAYLASGDFVGTKSGYTSSGTSFGARWAPLFVQTYSRKLGYQLWGCGDSNMAGTGSANGFMGFYRRSALRVGNRFPVIMSNFNQPGSSPSIYMSNVENIIDAVKPSAVVIFPFSYNTPATIANLNTNWARALNMANRISAYGGEPIFVGYPPRDSATADDDAVRRMGLERLAYAAASGFRTVDPNVYVSTEDVPAQWVTGMSDDGVHFSNLGHAVTADLLTVQLAEAFGE